MNMLWNAQNLMPWDQKGGNRRDKDTDNSFSSHHLHFIIQWYYNSADTFLRRTTIKKGISPFYTLKLLCLFKIHPQTSKPGIVHPLTFNTVQFTPWTVCKNGFVADVAIYWALGI